MGDEMTAPGSREPVAERAGGSVAGDRAPKFLVNRDFARLWSGQAISGVGDFVFDTTLTLWIATVLLAGSRWAPAAVSGLMLCAFGATMVIGPLAGVFVDRWSKRRTMLLSELVRGTLVGVLAVITLVPRTAIPVGVWLVLLYVVVIVVNSAGQFFNPARFATIGEIVHGESDRAKAFGLSQATAAGAVILGPPIAAPLLFALGIQWAMFLNAASYAVSFLAIRSVVFPASDAGRGSRIAAAAGGPAWRAEFADGLKMFARNRYLVTMSCVAVISSLGTGGVTPLLVFFVSDNLHVRASFLGILLMAFGGGAVAGGLVAGRLTRLLNARRVTWLCLLAGGAVFLVLARQTNFAAALVLMFCMAIPVAAMNAGLSSQLLAVTPREFTGRMFAVLTPLMTAASMISVVLAGLLASTALRDFHGSIAGIHISGIDTIFSVSALLILAAGTYAYFALPPTEQKTSAGPRVTQN